MAHNVAYIMLRVRAARADRCKDGDVPYVARRRVIVRRVESRGMMIPLVDSTPTTHFENCWRYTAHHACCVARVKALERELEQIRNERSLELKCMRKDAANIASLAVYNCCQQHVECHPATPQTFPVRMVLETAIDEALDDAQWDIEWIQDSVNVQELWQRVRELTRELETARREIERLQIELIKLKGTNQ